MLTKFLLISVLLRISLVLSAPRYSRNKNSYKTVDFRHKRDIHSSGLDPAQHAYIDKPNRNEMQVQFQAYGKQFLARLKRDEEKVLVEHNGKAEHVESTFYTGEL